jgi:hypothetical protein
MLSVLQGAGDIAARLVFGGKSGEFMREDASRNWTFRVPKKITVPAWAATPAAQQIVSIDFDMPRTDVIAFTFSQPVFWAVVLAAPGPRRNLRCILAGTGLIGLVQVTLLLTFAATSAHRAVTEVLSLPLGAFETWLLRFGEYLTVLVIPFAAPIVIAFAVHRELRRDVLGWPTHDVHSPSPVGRDARSIPVRHSLT